jgi:putative spermidine/putrescine transport system permease protein
MNKISKFLLLFLTGIFGFFIVIPFFLIFLLSIFSSYRYPNLLPFGFTIEYWKNLLLHNSLLIKAFSNSILIGFSGGIASTIVGFMAAKSLVKSGWFQKKRSFIFYTVPLLIPTTALFIGVHLMMIRLSIANSYTAIILTHMLILVPYATNIGISYFKAIAPEIKEIGQTLGANSWYLFRKLELPLLLPGLVFSVALCFLLSNSDFFGTFLMGGGSIITLSTLLYPYLQNTDYGNGGTLAIIFLILHGIVFYLTDSYSNQKTKQRKYLY